MAPASNSSAGPSSGFSIASVDDLVNANLDVRSQPTGSEAFYILAQNLAAALRKLLKTGVNKLSSGDVLRSPLADGSDPLLALIANGARPGLAFLAVLLARLEVDDAPSRKHLGIYINHFCAQFDGNECKYMPESVSLLAEWIHYIFAYDRSVVDAYANLANEHSRATEYYFVTLLSWHHHLLRAALVNRAYSTVRRLVEKPIDNIDFNISTVTIQHFLLYHYYAGCILAATGEHAKAISAFETAITVPGTAASAISLDAYKKYILVSLLSTGKVAALPKYTSSVVSSAFKSHCSIYLDLESSFTAFERSKVRELAKKHQELFIKDGNWGLVLQVLQRLKIQAILRLRRSYITVSLQEVANAMEEDQGTVSTERLTAAEQAVVGLIQSGEIFASLSHAADGSVTITFIDDPEPYNSEQTIAMLNKKIRSAQRVGEQTSYADRSIARSKEFLQKALKQNVSLATNDESANLAAFEDEELY